MTFIVRQITLKVDGSEIIRSNAFDSEDISVGRNAENAIHLPDLAVNPEHATITRREDGHVEVKSVSGQSFTHDGLTRIAVTFDPAKGAELGFGGHVITVGEEEDGTTFTVNRVEALSDSAEARNENNLYTLKGLLPGKRISAWGFIALVLAAFLVWPIYTWATWRGVEERPAGEFYADTMWSSGELSDAHHGLKNDCQSCHVDAFESVRDDTCMNCHEDDANPHAKSKRLLTAMGEPEGFEKIGAAFAHAFGKEPGRCVECHTEHEGAGAMEPTSQKFCADCHEGMDTRLTDTKLGNAADFGIEHPQFQPLVLMQPGKDAIYERKSLDDNPTHNNGLKFPHKLHLSKTNGVAQMGRRLSNKFGFGDSLACADCHTEDPSGVRFEPVNMEEDCSMCHSLAFDKIGGTIRTLRHGEPAQVRADLQAYYRSTGPRRPINLGGMARRRPGDVNKVRVAKDYSRAVKFRPSRANMAIAQVFSRGGACFDCHGVTPPTARGRVDYAIKPVSQTDRFMHKGWFNHKPHNDEQCSTCHEAGQSTQASDLLLPGIKTCRDCHEGEFSKTADVPSSCAMCHEYHADGGEPWLIREQKKEKRTKPETAMTKYLRSADKPKKTNYKIKIRKQKIALR